jgi:hypothetical protein
VLAHGYIESHVNFLFFEVLLPTLSLGNERHYLVWALFYLRSFYCAHFLVMCNVVLINVYVMTTCRFIFLAAVKMLRGNVQHWKDRDH